MATRWHAPLYRVANLRETQQLGDDGIALYTFYMSDVIYSTEWSSQQKKAAGKQVSGNQRKAAPVAVEPLRNLPNDGVVRVGRETQGRKGGGVTVVTGVPLEGDALIAYAKELKQRLGCGGTCKDGIIEIQGDKRDQLMTELAKKGWKVKRVGG